MKNLNDHAGIDLDTLVSKNVNKKSQIMMWKSPLFSNDLCLEEKSAFERDEERIAFPKCRLAVPSGLCMWTGFMGALGDFSTCSPWRQMAACPECFKTLEKPLEKDSPLCLPPFWHWWGVDRAGEGSWFCHFPCCTPSVVKKRLQTPELSIWHFSLALKNFKTY